MSINFKKIMGYGYEKKLTKKESKPKVNMVIEDIIKDTNLQKKQLYTIIEEPSEKQIENTEKNIGKLENKIHSLSNQVLNLEDEKNNLLQELNKSRYFEESVFSIKEKDYIDEIKSKENIIKDTQLKFSSICEKIDEQKNRLSYKDDIIKEYTTANKELKEKINKLNYTINYQKKNSKEVINEIKSERKRTYQDYANNLDAYEDVIISKNESINNYKTKLKESLSELKEANEKISNLKGEIYSLSNKVNSFSSLSQENLALQQELQKAENFENSFARVNKYVNEIKVKDNIIENKRQELLEGVRQINDLGTKINSLQIKNKKDKEIIENLKSTVKESEDSFILKIDYFENLMKKKDSYIADLKKKSQTLSENVIALSDLASENYILQNKLQKTENFENSFARVDKYKDEIKVKDNIIEDKRQELLGSIRQINNLSTKIDNLQTKNRQDEEIIENLKSNEDLFISEIDNFKNLMAKKDSYMTKLKKESKSLSEKVIALSDLARDNRFLQNKLQEAEHFQNVINDKKDRFDKFLKEKSNLNISNVIKLLTDVSREKQGNQKLTWNNWLNIPENNYLLNLDEETAKNIFNQSNSLIQKQEEMKRKTQTVGHKVVKTHYSLALDGVNQGIVTSFPSDHDTDPAQVDRTYSWWMKASETGRNRSVFGYGLANREGFNINDNQGTLWGGNSWYARWDTPEDEDNKWHHWMAFNDVSHASLCKLYIDGELKTQDRTSDSGASGDHVDPLTIGTCDNGTSADQYFSGSLANFAVFSGDVTDRAVSHYNNGIPKDLTGEAGLEGYWRMDEGSGTTVVDQSGNDNDGTTTNNPTWVTIMKETDHVQSGITYTENLTTGKLEDPSV